MPPLSPAELVAGYLAGAVGRGLFVAAAILVVAAIFLSLGVAHPGWVLVYVVLGSALMGGLGIIAAILANKFDQMAAITNFIITPLSFLSGTFYSVEGLPPAMQVLTHVNPIFYLIDGVRFGVLGTSDSSPWIGLPICLLATGLVLSLCLRWFRTGFRLKA